MKTAIRPLIIALLGTPAAVQAATINAFWSAQTEQDAIANGGSFNPAPTASNFPTPVSVSLSGSHVVADGGMPGGAPAFTDYQGNTWNGVPGATGAGYAFGWNGTSTIGSDAITISLDLTNIRDLAIRMDVRSAQGGTAPRPPAFSAIEYSLGDENYLPIDGADLGNFTSNSYVAMNFDLSSLDAIEGSPVVLIRFTVADTPGTTSFRVDNIQLTADTIPEPAASMVLAMTAGLAFGRRKRA